MKDITVQMRLPRTVRVFLSLMIMVLSFCFCGCSSKSTVTCIPDEEFSPQEEQSQLTSQDDVNDEISKALRQYFTSWQGTRYIYGGLSRKGVDCSGFSLLTYKELFGRNLPRTVREQVKEGARISKASLQAGDLVFFKTGLFQKHVGIYLEDDLFIHVSRKKGVMISSLNNVYWRKKFWQAQRIQAEVDLEKLSSGIIQQTAAADS